MARSGIPRALLVAGGILLVAYGFGYAAVLSWDRERSSNAADDLAAHAQSDLVHYRVSHPDGREEIIALPANDPGLMATALSGFNRGTEVNRISAREAQIEMDSGMPGTAALSGILLVLPLLLMFTGMRIRAHEDRLQGAWTILGASLTEDSEELMEKLGLSRGALERTVKKLNERVGTDLRWDEHSDRIYDERLVGYTIGVQFCPRCNGLMNTRVRTDLLNVPTCQSCLSPTDRASLNELKRDVVENLITDSTRRRGQQPVDPRFKPITFALLALVFPPAAAAYALNAHA